MRLTAYLSVQAGSAAARRLGVRGREGAIVTDTGDFDAFFRAATGQAPWPYQRRLGNGTEWPGLIEVPTGLGKTLAVVVAWLWRRRAEHHTRATTPRRLVYCLPMRVLVEQTRDVVVDVVARLALPVRVGVLMGGVDDSDAWDTRPEEDLILIGTQDMLLSRALNRGYGMSRYRWPLHFGLVNNDCLWIIDEVQLLGSGLSTTTQLQALRRKLGTVLPTQTSWMSATISDDWLRTVDVEPADLGTRLTLDGDDRRNAVVRQRLEAKKGLSRAKAMMGDAKMLASEVATAHRPRTRTLVILNTVDRARELFECLRKSKPRAELVLVHSRFRSPDRAAALARATAEPGDAGTIVVSTQVIEAGVDLTSSTMFTEVAPWASLVQRFGRCNRRGGDADARIFWVAAPRDEKERAKLARPYPPEELGRAENVLATLEDVGVVSLPRQEMSLETGVVLRRRDLFDLFDTTADLMGNDVDVSRFIRDSDDHDLRVFWRDFENEPEASITSPAREELCAAPIAVVTEWKKSDRSMWRWEGLLGLWAPVEKVQPGMTVLLRASEGGYSPVTGLSPKSFDTVEVISSRPAAREEDRLYDGDPESEWRRWYLLSQHAADVGDEAGHLARALALPLEGESLGEALVTAGRWHDAGKVHPVWQAAAKRLGESPPDAPVAKSFAQKGHLRYEGRRGFRHELASALLALQRGQPDLVCYLVACHHGKVRVSIRSLPNEARPVGPDGVEVATARHARGVWDGDELPKVDLGGGLIVPPTRLTLRYMDLGEDELTGPSWTARVLALRDSPELGPFRLGFLEALIKCADERASRRARKESSDD